MAFSLSRLRIAEQEKAILQGNSLSTHQRALHVHKSQLQKHVKFSYLNRNTTFQGTAILILLSADHLAFVCFRTTCR